MNIIKTMNELSSRKLPTFIEELDPSVSAKMVKLIGDDVFDQPYYRKENGDILSHNEIRATMLCLLLEVE